jgi:hypothetical protein
MLRRTLEVTMAWPDEQEALYRRDRASRNASRVTWAVIFIGMANMSMGGLLVLSVGLLASAAVAAYLAIDYGATHCAGQTLRDCREAAPLFAYWVLALCLSLVGLAGFGTLALRFLYRNPWMILLGAVLAVFYLWATR